jgi:hypothetical protein
VRQPRAALAILPSSGGDQNSQKIDNYLTFRVPSERLQTPVYFNILCNIHLSFSTDCRYLSSRGAECEYNGRQLQITLPVPAGSAGLAKIRQRTILYHIEIVFYQFETDSNRCVGAHQRADSTYQDTGME